MRSSGNLELRMSYACNNLCRFCREGDARERVPDMSVDAALKLLKRKRAECCGLVISGGEPTLIDSLPDIVRAAKDDFGYEDVRIETNARRAAYKKYARMIAASGADRFVVSIHGHCAPLHDYLTCRPGSFAETVLGIRNLLDAGAAVETRTVITRPSVYSLADIAAFIAAAGVEKTAFVFPAAAGCAAANVFAVVPFISVAARHAEEIGRAHV